METVETPCKNNEQTTNALQLDAHSIDPADNSNVSNVYSNILECVCVDLSGSIDIMSHLTRDTMKRTSVHMRLRVKNHIHQNNNRRYDTMERGMERMTA